MNNLHKRPANTDFLFLFTFTMNIHSNGFKYEKKITVVTAMDLNSKHFNTDKAVDFSVKVETQCPTPSGGTKTRNPEAVLRHFFSSCPEPVRYWLPVAMVTTVCGLPHLRFFVKDAVSRATTGFLPNTNESLCAIAIVSGKSDITNQHAHDNRKMSNTTYRTAIHYMVEV